MNEQAIIKALRNLPVSIQLTPDYSQASGGYIWQCLDGSGSSPDLAAALSESLSFLIGRLAADSGLNLQPVTLRGVVEDRKRRAQAQE
jgi:hypothetical protein